MIETKKHENAVRFAVENGDPNFIEKTFEQLMKKARAKGYEGVNKMLEHVNKVEDGMRQLRNWAKRKGDSQLLSLMIEFQTKRMLEERANPKNRVPQINLSNEFT